MASLSRRCSNVRGLGGGGDVVACAAEGFGSADSAGAGDGTEADADGACAVNVLDVFGRCDVTSHDAPRAMVPRKTARNLERNIRLGSYHGGCLRRSGMRFEKDDGLEGLTFSQRSATSAQTFGAV